MAQVYVTVDAGEAEVDAYALNIVRAQVNANTAFFYNAPTHGPLPRHYVWTDIYPTCMTDIIWLTYMADTNNRRGNFRDVHSDAPARLVIHAPLLVNHKHISYNDIPGTFIVVME